MISNPATTAMSTIRRLIREAGSKNEESHDRSGAFSYSAEAHAASIGFGVGFAASITEDYRFVGALLTILFEVDREENAEPIRIAVDLLKEPHYAIGGLSAGLLVGSLKDLSRALRSK